MSTYYMNKMCHNMSQQCQQKCHNKKMWKFLVEVTKAYKVHVLLEKCPCNLKDVVYVRQPSSIFMSYDYLHIVTVNKTCSECLALIFTYVISINTRLSW